MLPTLLRDPDISLTVSQQGIHTRGYNNPDISETTSRARAKTQLESRQGFACTSTIKLEPLQVENYK
jgi:hypothetical protein